MKSKEEIEIRLIDKEKEYEETESQEDYMSIVDEIVSLEWVLDINQDDKDPDDVIKKFMSVKR